MSEKKQFLDADGEVIGVWTHFADRRPTRHSSRAHLVPTGSEGPQRFVVRCTRRPLLAGYGAEPLTLLGNFAPDHLLLRGKTVIADRPDLIAMGLDPRKRTVIADTSRPLQLWCPNHRDGHDVDPALLRAELSRLPSTPGKTVAELAVERVERQS